MKPKHCIKDNAIAPKRAARLTVMTVFILAAAHALAGESRILMGPYVSSVTPDSAKVMWVTGRDASAGSVAYAGGKAEAVLSGFDGRKEVLHTAALKGLTPSTTYEYEIVDTGSDGSFITAPEPGNSVKTLRFIVYGDTRTKPDRHRSVSEAMANEKDVSFVAMSGDLVSRGETWRAWEKEFFTPGRSYLRKMAVWPVRGNHEDEAIFYRELFDLPGNERWYSFDYGNLHFIALDCYAKGKDRDAQLEWLKLDLESTKAEWIFACYHAPTFNIGGHASKWGAKDVLPILEDRGVDVVVTGHSHLYERFVPIGPTGKKPLIHIVTGGGGAPNASAKESALLEGGAGRSALHYCLFEIQGNTLTMVVKQPDGTVIDNMTLVKKDGMYQDDVMKKSVETGRARELIDSSQRK